MKKRILYSFLLSFISFCCCFGQESSSSAAAYNLLYFYNSELEKLEKEIAVEEAEYELTSHSAILASLNKKKLKREILNIYGSKSLKKNAVLLKKFSYFSASEVFLKQQKEIEENYDLVININVTERTRQSVDGLAIKVTPLLASDESSASNRSSEIIVETEGDSLYYELKVNSVLAAELPTGEETLKRGYALSSASQQLATTEFMKLVNTFFSTLKVRFDIKNISELWELRNADSTITFITPAGLPFTLKLKFLSSASFSFNDDGSETRSSEFFADGALQSFTYANVKYKRCRSEIHKEEFAGYYVDVNSTCSGKMLDSLTKKITQRQPVVVVHACIENHKLVFKANKIPLQQNVLWPSQDHYGSGTYKPILPVIYAQMMEPTVKLSAAELTSGYSPEAKRFLESLDICDRNYIPYAITVANIISKYPGIVSQCYGLQTLIDDFDLRKHLLSVSSNVSPGGRDPLQQYEDKVVRLMQRAIELQRYANTGIVSDSFTRNFSTPSAISEFANNSTNFCTLNFLSTEERLRLLKVLITDNSEATQEAIVNLFRTLNLEISDIETIEFFTNLAAPSSTLVGAPILISQIYEVTSGGDYVDLNKALCEKFAAKPGVLDYFFPKTEAEEFNTLFYYDDSYLIFKPDIGIHEYTVVVLPSGVVQVQKRYVVDKVTTYEEGYNGPVPEVKIIWSAVSTLTLNPFTVITFINRTALSVLAEAGSGSPVITAPAIFLKFAADQTFKHDAIRTAAFIVDVVTIASGPGLVVKAYRAGRTALAFYEGAQIVGALANITVNALDLNPEERKWVDNFNIAVAVWGGVRLLSNKNLYSLDYYKLVRNNSFKGLDKEFLQDLIQRYAILKKGLSSKLKNAQLSKQMDEVIEYLRGVVKTGGFDLKTKRSVWMSSLKTNYDFNKNFIPEGLDPNTISAVLKNEMLSHFSNNLPQTMKENFLQTLLKSGKTPPVSRVTKKGESLFKIVPKDNVPGKSSFYVSKSEFDILENSLDLEQKLGLPLNSHSVEYDVYMAIPKEDIIVFESIVAKTSQGTYVTTGGAIQTLILDVDKCSLTKIKTILPQK